MKDEEQKENHYPEWPEFYVLIENDYDLSESKTSKPAVFIFVATMHKFVIYCEKYKIDHFAINTARDDIKKITVLKLKELINEKIHNLYKTT